MAGRKKGGQRNAVKKSLSLSLDRTLGSGKLTSENMKTLLILLVIVLALRYAGRRLVPLAMPQSFLKTVAVGLVGGAMGTLLLELGPRLWGVNLASATMGAALAILLLGTLPFLRILLGRG
jgi:uncharacterized membrane protein YeaQ/YmgE (transglycosylase-associated protein family)